jgi:hypothetical protein
MRHILGKLVARTAFIIALVVGLGGPTSAQVTIKCWKEGCITVNGQTSCIREEIPCPTGTKMT